MDSLNAIGAKYGATAGQVALAWLLAQGPDVIPIPGTRTLKVRDVVRCLFYLMVKWRLFVQYLDENLGAMKLSLTPEDVAEVRRLAEAADERQTVGARYNALGIQLSYLETPPLN